MNTFSEFDLIKNLSERFSKNLDNIVGIGDDCSVVPFDEKYSQITTTDLLVEDVHFLKNKISAKDLAYRSIAVNISDIAAMGGHPEHIYLSLGLPKNLSPSYLNEFLEAFENTCKHYGVKVLGGDTSSCEKIVINILVQGKVEKEAVKLRSKAKEGDFVCTTGVLADSAIGLGILFEKYVTKHDSYFLEKHKTPRPHLEEGRWLSKWSEVHSMIDISDGIFADLGHICEQSKVQGVLDLKDLPLSIEAKNFFKENKEAFTDCISSGEDFILIFTVARHALEKISADFYKNFQRPLYKIGHIEKGSGVKLLLDGEIYDPAQKGFDHFGASQ